MEYHLHRGGQNVGVFPLEELRRRRDAGELSGEDLVWCEGMTDWAPLASVLQANEIPTSRKTTRLPVWAKISAIVLALICLVFAGFVSVKFLQGVRLAKQVEELTDAPDAVEVASKPIISKPTTLTAEDVRKKKGDFRVRQYVDGYRKNGLHSDAWDADALQLIKSWLALNYGGPIGLPEPGLLSDKLVSRSGCNDPLVLTVAGVNTAEPNESIRRLERALGGFENSRHLAYPKLYATLLLANKMEAESPRIRPLYDAALQHFQNAFTDGSYQSGDEEEIADCLVMGWAQRFFYGNGPAVCAIASQSKLDPWLGLVLDGENNITEAWKIRGSGFADKVTREGWEGFNKHLAKARTALTRAWKLHPDWPIAPSRMIYVALGDSDIAEMRTWFDRTLDAQIDYQQAWTDLRWGLRPRWHGNLEAIIALGVQAVDSRRFDTDVPRMFFDCISDVESELKLPPGKHIYGRPDIWPHLKRMYEGYLIEPSKAQWRDGWRSTYAAVAFLAGDYKVAREQLEAVNWKPVRFNLTGWGTDLSDMPLKVAALTGNSGGKVEAAEENYVLRDYSEAIEAYTALKTATETDERTREFSRHRLAEMQQEKLLARGEGIELMPADDKDPNWEFCGGKLRRLQDGGLEVESDSSGHGFYCRTHVGPAFEVTGEFELVRSSTKEFQAGLIMGLPDSPNSVWYAFRIRRKVQVGDTVSFSRGWTSHEVAGFTSLNQGRNSFQVQIQPTNTDVWLNGTKVMHITPSDGSSKSLQLHSDCMLGLGAPNDKNDTVIRYYNVKARRLTK